LSPDYSYKELTAMLMKSGRREERNSRIITSYGEVLYVLNTDLYHVFQLGGEYPSYRLLVSYFITRSTWTSNLSITWLENDVSGVTFMPVFK